MTEFKTNVTAGLSASSIGALLRHYGPNKLESEEQEHIALRYIGQFKDPLILLLLGSAVLSVIVGQYEDAMSIAVAVLIVGSVAFYQEYQSEKSIDALNDLVPPRCNVVRDGKVANVLAEELVPGDVIRLQSGDRVPADARVVQSTSLSVDESSLTGEQEPREKTVAALPDLADDTEISARANMVFMGTLVCSGHALAVVTATALATEFGKTFQEMKDIENRRTPLQIKMDELGKKLSVFSFGIIGCIGALGMFQGKTFMSMFNIGVSLAVAAIPEGLPICVTVTLALGVMRMARKNAIVKKLPAVEALGCANYICTDKTGTLTENRMTAIRVYCPAMEDAVALVPAPTPPKADNGARTNGIRGAHGSAASLISSSSAASLLGLASGGGGGGNGSAVGSGSSSSGSSSGSGSGSGNNSSTSSSGSNGAGNGKSPHGAWQAVYNGQAVDVLRHPCLHRLFDASALCNNAHLQHDHSGALGQPTEAALLLAAHRLGVVDRRDVLKRTHETGFSSENKYMEVGALSG